MTNPRISELLAAIRGDMDGEALQLSATHLPPSAARDFVSLLPLRRLALTTVEITEPEAGTFELNAQTEETWMVAPSAETLQLRSLTLVCRDEDPGVAVELTVSADLQLAAGEVPVQGTLSEDAALTFTLVDSSTSHPVSATDLFALAGPDAPAPLLPQALDPSLPLSTVHAVISFAGGVRAGLELGCATSLELTLIPNELVLALSEVRVRNSRTFHPRLGERTSFGGELRGQVTIHGAEFGTRIGVFHRRMLEVEVVPREGNVLPGVTALAGLLGGSEAKASVQSAIDEHGLELSVDHVLMRVQVEPLQLSRLEVRCSLAFDDLCFLVTVHFPNVTFEGGLAPDSPPIQLGRFLAELPGLDDFPQLLLTELQISATPGQGRFNFHAVVHSDWELTLGKLTLGVSYLELDLHRRANESPTGSMQLHFDLLGTQFKGQIRRVDAAGAWNLDAEMVPGEPLSLTELLADLLELFDLPTVPHAPDLLLEAFSMSLTFGGEGGSTFRLSALTSAPGRLPLGNNLHDAHGRVELEFLPVDGGGATFSGVFEADLRIGRALFAVRYAFDKEEHVFEGLMSAYGTDHIELADLARALGIDAAPAGAPPSGATVELRGVAFRYQHETHTFSLAARGHVSEPLAIEGDAFVVAGKPSPEDDWGLVFGFDVQADQLAKAAGGDVDLSAADSLRFEQLAVMLSTRAWETLQIPQLPDLAADDGGGSFLRELPNKTITIRAAGLSLLAILDLPGSAEADPVLAALNARTAPTQPPKVFAQLTLAKDDVELEARLEGGVHLGKPGGESLALADAGLRLSLLPQPGVAAYGTFLVPIGDTLLLATAGLSITTVEAHGRVDLRFLDEGGSPASISFDALPGIGLTNLGILLGAVFEPPGVELGIQCGFTLGDQAAGANELALILEMVGEIPNPLLLYARIPDLSLQRLLDAVGMTLAVPAVLRKISIEELILYFAEAEVELPDGSGAKPGVYTQGLFVLGSFHAFARLEASKSTGFSGFAQCSPVDLCNGTFVLRGESEAVTTTEEQVDGTWQWLGKRPGSIPAPGAPPNPHPTRETPIVKGGGPVVSVSTQHDPHVDVDLEVSVFGAVGVHLHVTVGESAFRFDLEAALGEVAHARLDCQFSKDSFAAAAEVEVDLHVQVDLPLIKGGRAHELDLDMILSAGLSVEADKDGFELDITGHLAFDGKEVVGVEIHLATGELSSLDELPGKIIEWIVEHVGRLLSALVDEIERDIEAAGKELARLIDQLTNYQTTYAARGGRRIEVERVPSEALRVFARAVDDPATLHAEASALQERAREIEADAETMVAEILAQAEAEAARLRSRAATLRTDAAAEVQRIAVSLEQEYAAHREAASRLERRAAEARERHEHASLAEVKAWASSAEADAEAVRQRRRAVAAAHHAAAERIRSAVVAAQIGHAGAPPKHTLITRGGRP